MSGCGLFITLEGTDGTGKSSQIRLLALALKARGHRPLVTAEPGGTRFGNKLRKILLDPATGDLDPRTEVFLYEAARVEHLRRVILPALDKGRTVLCSRYTDSTLAYQGGGRGLKRGELDWLNRWATGGLKPHRSLVLVLSPEEGLRRARKRGRPDRFESQGRAFQDRVSAAFRKVAVREPRRVRLVDARGSRAEVSQRLLKALGKLGAP